MSVSLLQAPAAPAPPTPARLPDVLLPNPFIVTEHLEKVLEELGLHEDDVELEAPDPIGNGFFQGPGGLLPSLTKRQHGMNLVAAEVLGRLAQNVLIAAYEEPDPPSAPPSAKAAKAAEVARLEAEAAAAELEADRARGAAFEAALTTAEWKRRACEAARRELAET